MHGSNQRRRTLLDNFLMAPLHRTFALSQVDQVAVEIARNLDFDMPRLLDHFLDINLARMESPLCLAGRVADGSFQLALRVHAPHPFAASAGRRLQQHRISQPRCQLARMLQIRSRLFASRHHRNIHLFGQNPCGGLRSQPPYGIGRWSNENNPRVFACRRKPRILAQKSIARMDCLNFMFLRNFQN